MNQKYIFGIILIILIILFYYYYTKSDNIEKPIKQENYTSLCRTCGGIYCSICNDCLCNCVHYDRASKYSSDELEKYTADELAKAFTTEAEVKKQLSKRMTLFTKSAGGRETSLENGKNDITTLNIKNGSRNK